MSVRVRWGHGVQEALRLSARDARLHRFGRRYFRASRSTARQGHDYRMQAVRKAALICGSLDYLAIQAVTGGWNDAEDECEVGT